jgi:molybdate transport system substrate-binding protein
MAAMQRRPALLLAIALITLAGLAGCRKRSAKQINVAAAADLSAAFEELGKAFTKQSGITPKFTFGSSGNLSKQIAEQGPFDLFASANVAYVDAAVASGACDAATKAIYGRGRIAMWWRADSALAAPATLSDLADARFQHIALANPEHAPYGKAGKQALEAAGVWAQVASRMVYGENVKQTLQYAETGNADVGIVALSLALVAKGGRYVLVDDALHAPLEQALVVCKHGGNQAGAQQFADFLASPEGRGLMKQYGFALPGE